MTIIEMRPNIEETSSVDELRNELCTSYDGFTHTERQTREDQAYRYETEMRPRLEWQKHLDEMAKYFGHIVLAEE